jgi:hypothetical protein
LPYFWEHLINLSRALTGSGAVTAVILGVFITIVPGLGQISGIAKSGNTIAHLVWIPAVINKARFDSMVKNLNILIPCQILKPDTFPTFINPPLCNPLLERIT